MHMFLHHKLALVCSSFTIVKPNACDVVGKTLEPDPVSKPKLTSQVYSVLENLSVRLNLMHLLAGSVNNPKVKFIVYISTIFAEDERGFIYPSGKCVVPLTACRGAVFDMKPVSQVFLLRWCFCHVCGSLIRAIYLTFNISVVLWNLCFTIQR